MSTDVMKKTEHSVYTKRRRFSKKEMPNFLEYWVLGEAHRIRVFPSMFHPILVSVFPLLVHRYPLTIQTVKSNLVLNGCYCYRYSKLVVK